MHLAAWKSAMSLLISALLLWMYPHGQMPMHFSPLFKDKMYIFKEFSFQKEVEDTFMDSPSLTKNCPSLTASPFKGTVKATISSISPLSKKHDQSHIIFNIYSFKGIVNISPFKRIGKSQ